METNRMALLAVLSTVVLLYLYFGFVVRSRFLNRFDRTVSFLLVKVAGFVMLGVIPFILFNYVAGLAPSETGLVAGKLSGKVPLTLFAVLLTVTAISFFPGFRKIASKQETESLKSQSTSSPGAVIAGWTIYILGYEYLFRGVLWFLCASSFGFFPALVINVLLYVVAHFGQERWLIIGSLPFGVILCLSAHLSGTFMLPFIVHCTLGVSYKYFTLYRRPQVNRSI